MSRVPSRTLGLGMPLPTLVQLPHRGHLHSFPKPSPLKLESRLGPCLHTVDWASQPEATYQVESGVGTLLGYHSSCDTRAWEMEVTPGLALLLSLEVI